ncbi:hypothetical protein DYY66_2271 [Candidatus Nitrosotalea sp. FS]|uniref:hypothetical protein n=1 Tax=Candidatus Nitrosotalea sp. FS TaxID=2341021 RepID=UPI00140B9764|nr:hypothetical protein [Candidatus Nitrosotalea sp. FS]NHH97979.1 hypothetical protein [Candidatus Nitrosotalea sp. FS]
MVPKKYLYGIIAGIAIAAVAVAVIEFLPMMGNGSTSGQVAFLDFTYDEENTDLKTRLASYHINMTKPIRLSSTADVAQYCNFIVDPKKQALVTYCTSTVLKNSQGTLGDITMVGTPDVPGLVVVALQSNPLMSNYGDIKTVFGVVLNSTICSCWDKEDPDGFPTLSALVDKLRDTHLQTKDPTTSTRTLPLGNKQFRVELTTNDSGYLWKLLVAK